MDPVQLKKTERLAICEAVRLVTKKAKNVTSCIASRKIALGIANGTLPPPQSIRVATGKPDGARNATGDWQWVS